MDRNRLFVFVCMLLQTGRASSTWPGFYHPSFTCEDWDNYTPGEFTTMASDGSRVGENFRVCRIFQGGPNDECSWYVKYSINGYYNNEWKGLNSQGEPAAAGTGCCSSTSNCATALGAGLWLKTQHRDLCCGPVGACWPVVFVDRYTWGRDVPGGVVPVHPTRTTSLNRNLDYYIIHHTATPNCSTHSSCSERVRNIQSYHMDPSKRGWDDIGYNFLIGGDNAYVYVGRGWDAQGAHTVGYNDRSIGIAIIGNYENEEPHPGIVESLKGLMKCGVERGKVKEDYALCGHLDLDSTACPGADLLSLVSGLDNHTCTR